MRRAFTLIELLASMTVFVLVVMLGAALLSTASGVTRTTVQRAALREEARSVFDRMTLDISRAVRFDTYQIQTSTGTNSVLSILSSLSQSGGVRLQRIDYRVSTNGLFRSTRTVGWNDSQDLFAIVENNGELLSPAVGQMVVQSLLNDGTTQPLLNTPSLRANPAPVGLRVGLILAGAGQRKTRALALPAATVTNGNPWLYLSSDEEQKGWRVSEKIFRLP